MAEIKVEKKEDGGGWMKWLLPLLAVGAIIFFASKGCGDEREDGTADPSPDTTAGSSNYDTGAGSSTSPSSPVGAVDTAGGAGAGSSTTGAVRDAGEVTGASDPSTFIDRPMELESTEVIRVVSDRGFTVGSSGQELFVMLDDKLNEGSAEKGVKIEPGQRLQIGGTLMSPPTAETKEERYRGLSAGESKELAAQKVYLHASTIAQAQ